MEIARSFTICISPEGGVFTADCAHFTFSSQRLAVHMWAAPRPQPPTSISRLRALLLSVWGVEMYIRSFFREILPRIFSHACCFIPALALHFWLHSVDSFHLFRGNPRRSPKCNRK